jgi:short-subunit dehydrogenase
VIAISGASRGIGLAIAKQFAEKGWQVAIAARSADALAQLQKEWKNNQWPPLLIFVGDLSKAEDCQKWGANLQENGSALAALVNNLGAFAPGSLLEGSVDQLEHFLTTNLLSSHYLTRACLPLLSKAPLANILTIGSVATTDWPTALAAYALSKHALEAWHRQLTKELSGTNIRTSLLRPGATFTSSWDGVDIDPALLLSADRVAAVATQMILSPANEHLEEVCLRPRT